MLSAPQPLTLTVITSTWEEFYHRMEVENQWAFKIWLASGVMPAPRVKLMTPDGEPG
jgi:hypothetical protein